MSKLKAKMDTIEYSVELTDDQYNAIKDKTIYYCDINPNLYIKLLYDGAKAEISDHYSNLIMFKIDADYQDQVPHILETIETFIDGVLEDE